MSQVNKETIYKNAIMTYGEIAQIDVAIEEMSELIQALSKYKRGKEHNVEEEKRTLERFTEQIEECGFKHNRNMFKEKK